MRSRTPARNAFLVSCFVLALWSSGLVAAQTPLTAEQQKATAEIHEYFRRTTVRLADAALADVKSLDDWQRQRPVLREQLLEMLGLSPLPERTELHATVTGTNERDDLDFVVEKLHFQSRPGLYVTANFYRPKVVDKPLPTILYLCGHGNVKIDGVSYGSKASYQHHPAWFAREGYCCLILDTLQLGEIEGLHHGTYREGMWWWASRGYTPAGVEAWNAVRALDYLATRPDVDMKKIGVTGRSGGGAYTWWLAGIDDRPACFVPVAGITDLENHVVDGCIEGHCDCMYMVNTYQWDFPTLAALAAPRPLLFSNSDKDKIFPLDGVVRTHAKLKNIYDLYGAADKLGLLITEGQHKDTQELQVPAFRWMNRWLQGRDTPITRVADKPFDPRQLRVFDELPADQRNTTAHEWFVPQFEPPALPTSRQQWESMRSEWLRQLKEKCFRSWPTAAAPLETKLINDQQSKNARYESFEFTSDENLRLRITVMRGLPSKKPSRLFVYVANLNELITLDGRISATGDVAQAVVATRGSGSAEWVPEQKKDTQIQRRFLLDGKTADDGRVWDVCRAVAALRSLDELSDAKIWLVGQGKMAPVALYATLLSPDVHALVLDRPATSHRDGSYFLNVLRIVDLPQSAAMVFPRMIFLQDMDRDAWAWTEGVAKLYSKQTLPIQFHRKEDEKGDIE